MKNIGILCLTGLAAIMFSGCSSTPNSGHFANLDASPAIAVTNKLNPDLLKPPVEPFVLGTGDKLDIEMQGNPATRNTVTIGMDGKIYYMLLPGVDVAGLTLTEARGRLEQELGKFYRQPQISLSLKEVASKHVWVVGRVNRPGSFPLNGTMTLIEAIATAGGTQESPSLITTQDMADLRHSFVMRKGKMLPVDFVRLIKEGDMSQNIYLKPDDLVFLPSAVYQQVYVLGAVQNPRAVPYTDELTVVSALAQVNGYLPDAYLRGIAILRGSLTEPHIVVVNYRAIIGGTASDVPLEPGDIVFIPLSPYRFITDYADLIVTTFVNAWSADMGVRVIQGSGNIGVSVPVSSGAATGGTGTTTGGTGH
jgi:polysaccharide export outer membrane protein